MEIHEVLDRLACSQHGLVTTRQLTELGMATRRRRQLVDCGRLIPVRRGVYRLCGSRPTWRSSALAAVMAAGPGSVLSHRSAAVLWELLDHRAESGRPLEVSCAGRCEIGGVLAHRHRLDAHERTVRFGIPVTTAARTLLDLAESTTPGDLGELVDEALRQRMVTVRGLEGQLVARSGSGRRRLSPMHQVLEERGRKYDPGANAWELKMDRLWDERGLPPAARQYAVSVNGHRYILDRAIVDLKIGVEWNGYEYHGLRSRFDRDSRRRSELATAGWQVLDFTTKSPAHLICGAVRSVVEQRRRLLGIAG